MASSAIAASDGMPAIDARKPLLRAQHVLDHVIGTLNNALAAATMLTIGATEAMSDTDLDTLVGLVVHDIAPDERQRIRVEGLSTARTVQLQPVLMRLALCNLLVNALAYSPAGSPVTLRIAESEDPLAIVFDVCDEGEGISPSLLPRLFEKGTRGPNVRSTAGAGLGLYIVRKVVELQHGRIEIVPNQPRGSIFRLAIPQGVET
jgi:two-component system OmpR family sensor kinase